MKEKEHKRQEVYYEEDEIDLYELWCVIKRRKWIVFAFTLLFLCIGVLYSILKSNVYRCDNIVLLPVKISLSESSLSESSLSESSLVSIDFTKKIVDVLETNKYINLGEFLDSKVCLEKIDNININSLSRKGKDMLFQLSIDSVDKNCLLPLTNATVQFFNSNQFIRSSIRNELKLVDAQIADIEKRIKIMSKIADRVRRLVLEGKNLNFNPVEIDKDILSLKSKLSYFNMLKNNRIHGYKIISQTTYDKPVKPKRGLIIAVSIVTGLFFGLFAAFFKEWLDSVGEEKGRG